MPDEHQVPVKIPVAQPCANDADGDCGHNAKPTPGHYDLGQYACNKANDGKKYQVLVVKIKVLNKLHH